MIRIWWIFYKKIFLYSLLLTGLAIPLAISLEDSAAPAFLAFIYAFISPFVHLFFYELNRPQEYYFYANLGLLKLRLWLITTGITLIMITVIFLLK